MQRMLLVSGGMLQQSFRLPQLFIFGLGLALAFALLFRLSLRRKLTLSVAGLLFGSLLLHLLLLRLYWQMLPAYAGAILLLILAVRRQPVARVLAGLGGLLVASSALCLLVVPLFYLPVPTGQYLVGTQILHLVDDGRPDPSFASGHRELMVQVWYPVAQPSGSFAPYRRLPETTRLSSYDAVLATHAYLGAPPAKGAKPFPMVLFNPGWMGQRTQNTFQVEDLASHGFVVVTIDHTHNSLPVAFPDGRVLRSTAEHGVDEFEGRSMSEVLAFARVEINTEVKDNSFTLDVFSGWASQPGSPWFHVVDAGDAGTLGHSFGGAVAVAACQADPRIRAALNMDGWLFQPAGTPKLGKPLAMMSSGDWPFRQQDIDLERRSAGIGEQMDVADLDYSMASMRASGGFFLAIDGALHMNFADRALYSHFRHFTDAGPGDPRAIHQIVNAYTVAFFSQALRGVHEALLEEGDVYPGAHVRVWEWPR